MTTIAEQMVLSNSEAEGPPIVLEVALSVKIRVGLYEELMKLEARP